MLFQRRLFHRRLLRRIFLYEVLYKIAPQEIAPQNILIQNPYTEYSTEDCFAGYPYIKPLYRIFYRKIL